MPNYQKEILNLENQGFKVVDRFSMDYGETHGVIVEKDGKIGKMMLREVFYDTDEDGNRTAFHGVIDMKKSKGKKGGGKRKC